ncbi:MAG: radical SAM protein [Candidatus Diapherotrites archaeon]
MIKVLKTGILLGYRCNNNCRFCYCADKKGVIAPMKTEEVKKQILAGRNRGSNFVDFLGGEPTLRADLPELVEFAKRVGFEQIGITTNGRVLSKKDYTKQLLDSGLNHVIFSLHGHNAELHDYLTRSPNSFVQATKGIKNVKELNPKAYVCINTVLLKQNLKVLPEIVRLAFELKANGMELIFPHPRGNAWHNFEEMVPNLEELIGPLHEALHLGHSLGIKHCFARYVPFCYMYGDLAFISEFFSKDFFAEHHIAPEYQDLEVAKNRAAYGRVKGPQCSACKYFKECEGIFKEYALKRGFSELVPVP